MIAHGHELIDRKAQTLTLAYPHQGGCAGCRTELRCNYCGEKFSPLVSPSFQRCTNGRCFECHRRVCTKVNEVGSHGYGEVR